MYETFTLTDKKPLVNLNGAQSAFERPAGTQFGSLEALCNTIVQVLQARHNFNVPGIEVKFWLQGNGDDKEITVYTISGEDFFIKFLGNHLSEVGIPRKELHVYSDESGPMFYYYVGNDWDADKKEFFHGSKVNSKLSGKERTYLQYKGAFSPPRGAYSNSYPAVWAKDRRPYLVHDNDLSREYEPVGDEPMYFSTTDVMHEMEEWLFVNILDRINALPDQEPIPLDQLFAEPAVMPVSQDFSNEYVIVGFWEEARQDHLFALMSGKKSDRIPPDERYAFRPNLRLVNLEVKNDGTMAEDAYDGFTWFVLLPRAEYEKMSELERCAIINKNRWSSREGKMPVVISPKTAQNVYVIDYAPQEEYKAKIFEDAPEQHTLTNEQYDDYRRLLGRTMTPINEYKGGFKSPAVVINREVGLDEVIYV